CRDTSCARSRSSCRSTYSIKVISSTCESAMRSVSFTGFLPRPVRDIAQRMSEFVPRAQQHHAHKRPPHAQSVCNFVVTHVRVVAHHQSHARPRAQLVERLANLFAGTFFDQLFELIWVG